jgi:hypothetical protein
MADIDDILKPQGSDYNFNFFRDATLGGLLTKFLMEHPLKNIFGNKQARDPGGRTYGQAMVQDDRSGRKPITGADGYQYWSDSGERVFPEQNRMGKAADGYWYYDDSGERVYPDVDKLLEEMFSRGGLLTGSEDGRKRNPLDEYWYYNDSGDKIEPSRAEIERLLQDRKSYQSQKAKDIQNLWKGLK